MTKLNNAISEKMYTKEQVEAEREKAFYAGRRYGKEECGTSPDCTIIQANPLKEPNFEEYSQQNPLK